MDYARARLNMVNNQLRPNRVDDPNVLDAMAEIPRERFLPKALRGVAYADEDLPLPDGGWLIEPVVLARLIQGAGVREADVVLVIGCSTGYAGVVLSRLAATVILVEPEAAAQAVERLLDELGVDNAAVVVSEDPAAGDPSQAPFDIVFLVGSVSVPPSLRADRETGRIVAVLDDGRIGKAAVHQAARRRRPARDVRCSDPAVSRARRQPRFRLLGRDRFATGLLFSPWAHPFT